MLEAEGQDTREMHRLQQRRVDLPDGYKVAPSGRAPSELPPSRACGSQGVLFRRSRVRGGPSLTRLRAGRGQGEDKGGLRWGLGVQRWRDGSLFAGQFVRDASDGFGCWRFSDSAVYEGQVAGGVPEGLGLLREETRE